MISNFTNFVRCQRLRARELAVLFGFNHGIRPFYAACSFDELSTRSPIPVFRNPFFDPQNPFLPGFLRISFFLFFFPEELLQWFWRGLENSCFRPLSQDFFAGIPTGQEFLYLHRIPTDSSGFLQIPPDSCSRLKLSDFGQRLKNALC